MLRIRVRGLDKEAVLIIMVLNYCDLLGCGGFFGKEVEGIFLFV